MSPTTAATRTGGLRRAAAAALLSLALLALVDLRASLPGQATAARPPSLDIAPVSLPGSHLENVFRLSGRIYSGSGPETEADFKALAALGIRMVVSVDGARPHVDLARRHGLQYVHLPIGYDGIPAEARLGLTRVVRERAGPIYVHCHHGRHRGPAAAAIACVADGAADSRSVLAILDKAGTSRDYAGLWEDVQQYVPPAPLVTLPELAEVSRIEPLTAAMVAIDHSFDTLRSLQERQVISAESGTGSEAYRASLLVAEGFHEAVRNLDTPDDLLRAALTDAEQRALALAEALRESRADDVPALFSRLKKSCSECHAAHRD